MMKATFQLISGEAAPFEQGPEGSALKMVRVPLAGHSAKTVKKKQLVAPGTLVAEHPDAGVGDMHSPVMGVVQDVTADAVTIKFEEPKAPAEGEEGPEIPEVSPVSLDGLEGDELAAALKKLGVSTAALSGATAVVINGLNPEPGISVSEALLAHHAATLEKGVAVLRRICADASFALAVAEGSAAKLEGCSVAQVSPVYPNSLAPLVIRAVTGRENPEGAVAVSLPALYAAGRAAETGLPVTETPMTIGGKNYMVKVGTPVGALLEKAGISPATGDRVILGGPLCGTAHHDLDAGAGKDDHGMFHVPGDAFPPVTDQACLNCGECIMVCPSRVNPGMLGRYAEFKMYERARSEHIDACIECGLCGYVCPGRRPLLQYIRLAKQELAAADAE